jgi:hypothetical protein
MTKKNKSIKKPEKGTRPITRFVIPAVLQLVFSIFLNLFYKYIPFFTDDFKEILMYFNISAFINIVGFAILIFYHKYWLEGLIRLITGITSFIATLAAYLVFPFDFEDFFGLHYLNTLLRLGLLVALVATAVGSLIEAINILSKSDES